MDDDDQMRLLGLVHNYVLVEILIQLYNMNNNNNDNNE